MEKNGFTHFYKMTLTETKLFLREPVSAFFTFIFPLVMLLIFGVIYGSLPDSGTGQSAISMLIPAFSAMIIGINGLMAITITMATYRERGILRRLSTTPVSPLVVLGSQVAVVLSMTVLGMLLLVAAGIMFFHVDFRANGFSLAAGFILGSISFYGIGFILAGSLPTIRMAQVVAMILLYPMLILSGAAWPRELMPAAVQNITRFIPLTYVVNLLRGLWIGENWSAHLQDVGILLGLLVLGAGISLKFFRWE